jgi:hypothetical protein
MPILALAACDNGKAVPVLEVDMECYNSGLDDSATFAVAKRFVSAKIYEDKADLIINGEKTMLLFADADEFQHLGFRTYSGEFPKSNIPLVFNFHINIKRQTVNHFTLTEKGDNFWMCEIELPFNFKRPAQTTNVCVDELKKLVMVKSDTFPCLASEFKGLMILKDKKWVELTAPQAKVISPNWDYDNKKFRSGACSYKTGYIDFGKDDACELLNNVKELVSK